MSITFTRAPEVKVGDPITSTQLAKLAAAFNSRLRSGLGDGAWRIVFYWLSLFRQARNPDESGFLFPALAEFFTAGYQMLGPAGGLPSGGGDPLKEESVWPYPDPGLDPEARGMLASTSVDAEWPVAGPGEPEGANLACQIMAYVFGAEAIDLYDESSRLSNPDGGGLSLSPSETPVEIWELAKQQRGAFDPTTGGVGSPAWDAARSHHSIAMSATSPHGNAYGSYLPTPDLAAEPCEDPGDGGPIPNNYLYHFTALKPGLPDKTYAGSCRPVGGNPYEDHVAYIGYASWAYFVHFNSGPPDILLTSDYLEGPYSGEARLRKTSNGALGRVLNAFSGEFRGSNTQRVDSGYWLQEAFDTQKFLTSQYHLAPNIGTEVGPGVTSIYPLFRIEGAPELTVPTGTVATHVQSGSTHHAYNANCTLTAFLVAAVQLSGPITIELLDGTTLIQSLTVTPDETGLVEQLVTLGTPVTPTSLRVKLATAAIFTAPGGIIEVECTELLIQKPTYEDLFLVLRLGGALTSGDSLDGSGIDETLARQIGENYFANGCITNAHGAVELPLADAAVNHNAVFDAARRLSQCIRIIPRQNFVAYAVEGGKSICWFKQHAQIGSLKVATLTGIAGPSSKEEFDFNGVLRGGASHAYVGAVLNPTSYTPAQLLGLGAVAVIGILEEDGTTLISTEDGTIIEPES